MTGRIFVTGDKHGSFYPLFGIAGKNELFETDILIICGDAGYVWNDDYVYKVQTLEQVFPGTVVFIDGNHENHAILNSLEEVIWNGGKAHKLGERVYHLMRGEIYSIYGNNFFTFGGARSTDQDRRTEGESWWAEEEPDAEEFKAGRRVLMENIDEIDYVITHETPLFAREFIKREKPIDDDYHVPAHFEDWYCEIFEGKRFKKWYCGHMHEDKEITPKLRVLFNDIRVIEDDTIIKWA